MAWRAQNADRVLRMTEQLVSALGTGQADLAPAHAVLSAAKAHYLDRDYSEAVSQAKRAEALAATLNERFDAYMAAWKALQGCREELEGLGMSADAIADVLGAAERTLSRRVDEDGSPVPDYVGATELLERAAAEARESASRARFTSRQILLASIAVEAISAVPSQATPSWLGLRLEELIEQATHELALGHLAEAERLASEAKERAEEARTGRAREQECLEEAAASLKPLRAESPAAERFAERLESTQDALAKGLPDPASADLVVARLSSQVASFVDRYGHAQRLLEHAEKVYARLKDGGFASYEVDGALSEARHALGRGDWATVKESVCRATESFARRRRDRDALARSITDFRGQITRFRDVQLPMLPDLRELLARAEEEFQSGRFSGAKEDLLVANVLLRRSLGSGS